MMQRFTSIAILGLFLFGLAAFSTPANALTFVQEKGGEAKKEEAKEGEEEEEEEEEDEFLAVVGGDVYTVTGGMLRGATVLAKNGKIEDIGYDVDVPEEADILDASGLRVYPGLIAANSSRIVGNEPPEDNTDVFALNLVLGLSTGMTTVVTGNTAAKLTYGTLDGIVVKKNLFTRLNLRRGQDFATLRTELEKIRDFNRKKAAYDIAKARGEEVEEPKPQGLNANYQKLMAGQTVGRVDRMNDSGDLRKLARLAQEFGFNAVVYGASEGWVVAGDLGRAGISCVVSPRTTRNMNRASNRPNGSRIENAAMLHDSGVPIAVIPRSTGISLSGLVGSDLFTLPVEASYAVRGGLSRQAALESITIEAARILGIDDFVGSLEVGKDADMILTDGDVLHYRTMVHFAVVNGRLAYDKANESLLSHIRPLDDPARFQEFIEQLEEVHGEDEATDEEGGEEEGGEEGGEGEGGEGEGGGEKKKEGGGGDDG